MKWFRKRAKPGRWYEEYQRDWRDAHPHGNLPGQFYLGDCWVSDTLSWDEQWFAQRGWRLPSLSAWSAR